MTLLAPGSKGLPTLFCTIQTLFCAGATPFRTSARGLLLAGSKRPFAPSPNHFREGYFHFSGNLPGPQLPKIRSFALGKRGLLEKVRTRSPATRDRNLQFRGAGSTGFFEFLPLLYLVKEFPRFGRKISAKIGESRLKLANLRGKPAKVSISGIVPGLGGWQKVVYVFFRVIPCGGEKPHRQNPPHPNPSIIPSSEKTLSRP